MFNPLLFFGRLHPLVVHLPIGALSLLALIEFASRLKWFKQTAHARGIVLLTALLTSLSAITFGLMLSSEGGYDASLLRWHKWSGIALGALILGTSIAFFKNRTRTYYGLLSTTMLLLTIASHFGGSMTHGKDYLTAYAPSWVRSLAGDSLPPPIVTPTKLDPATAVVFRDAIQPIFSQNCVSCHNADKQKGELRLDSLDGVRKGGTAGPCIVPADANASLLVQRLLLPDDDKKHMPPSGKRQPSEDQIAVLRWWIQAKAPADDRIASLNPPANITEIIFTGDQRAGHPTLAPAVPVATPLPALPDDLADLTAHFAESRVVISPVSQDRPLLVCNASRSTSFGDAEIKQLESLAPYIEELNLAGTKVTDAGLSIVAKMTHLERLRLERTAVTDAGLQSLKGLTHLSYLNLHDTAVTNAGLQSLRSIQALHHVFVWHTRVDPPTARAFATAMVDQDKLAKLRRDVELIEAQMRNMAVEVDAGAAMPSTAPAATVPAAVTTTVVTTAPAPAPTSAPADPVLATDETAVAPIPTVEPPSPQPATKPATQAVIHPAEK